MGDSVNLLLKPSDEMVVAQAHLQLIGIEPGTSKAGYCTVLVTLCDGKSCHGLLLTPAIVSPF